MITVAKIQGLRNRLAADGEVVFRNGAVVRLRQCSHCGGRGQTRPVELHGIEITDPATCGWCMGQREIVEITRGMGGWSGETVDDLGLARAYRLALRGRPSTTVPDDAELDARFGAAAPW